MSTNCCDNCGAITSTQGQDGASAYIYIAYADDAAGAGFSNSDVSKSYIAIKKSTTAIASPVASDFAGLWHLWTGSNGTSGMIVIGDIDASGDPDYPAAVQFACYRIIKSGRVGGAAVLTPGKRVFAYTDPTTGFLNGCDLIIAINASAGGAEAVAGQDWFVIKQTAFAPAAGEGSFVQNIKPSSTLATVTGDESVALAGTSTVSGNNSMSSGSGNNISSDNSMAVGDNNTISSSGTFNAAVGFGNTINAAATGAYAFGLSNTVGSNSSTAVGFSNSVSNSVGAVAAGNGNVISSTGVSNTTLGALNTISGTAAQSVALGKSNTINGAVIGAGALGNANAVSGGVIANSAIGYGNTVSGSGGGNVGAGQQNTISGTANGSFAGGYLNTITGDQSFVGGSNNSSTGTTNCNIIGYDGSSTAIHSLLTGRGGLSTIDGGRVHSSSFASKSGRFQVEDFSLAVVTANNTPTVLTGREDGGGTFIMPGECIWSFQATVTGSVAVATPPNIAGDMIEWRVKGRCGRYTVLFLILGGIAGTFVPGETVTGSISAATATVISVNGTSLYISNPTGTFGAADVVTGGTSGATGNWASNNFSIQSLMIGDLLWLDGGTAAPIGYTTIANTPNYASGGAVGGTTLSIGMSGSTLRFLVTGLVGNTIRWGGHLLISQTMLT